MSATAEQYFPLVVPATSLLLGLALLAGWRSLREHRYLLWLAGGYILTAIPLAAQILMDNTQLATWSLLTGALYCAGSWATAQGFAVRSGGKVSARVAMAISLGTLLALFCFSQLSDVHIDCPRTRRGFGLPEFLHQLRAGKGFLGVSQQFIQNIKFNI